MEKDMTHYSEFRGGVEWHVAYERNGNDKLPVSGYVMDNTGVERLIEVSHVEGTGLMFGEFVLKREDGESRTFETFDEAMDSANQYIYRQPEKELDRYPLYDLTGNEGIYHLGEADGTLYVANAFWSEQEPGYVNHGVFAVKGDDLEILTSGFYNGYLEIEDCVRDLARDFTPLEKPDIRFVAECSREFDTAAEYREALEEGKRWRPILVPSWSQIAEKIQPDKRETFYFSMGTSDFFPFKLPGWVEVKAGDRMEACELYSSHYPRRDGLINAAFVYDAEEWKRTGMGEFAPGHVCCQVIDSWGPYSDRQPSNERASGDTAPKRLSELVELVENGKTCAVFAVKSDTAPLDLVRLGGFEGSETMFRMSKDRDTTCITVFRNEGKPYHMEYGSSTTLVGEDRRKMRDLIMECVNLDFGIVTGGRNVRSNSDFDRLVENTCGPRDLDSPREFELIKTPAGDGSLFVNGQHIGHIRASDMDRWPSEKGLVMMGRPYEQPTGNGCTVITGEFVRASRLGMEPSLNDLTKEARHRSAERNSERPEREKGCRSPEMER